MTIINAWSKVSDLSNGELWAYSQIDGSGARVTIRVVTGEGISCGNVIDWTLDPDEADMLIAMLKKVAEWQTHEEPVAEPSATPATQEASEPIGEVFIRQEVQEARPQTFKEKLEQTLGKLNP